MFLIVCSCSLFNLFLKHVLIYKSLLFFLICLFCSIYLACFHVCMSNVYLDVCLSCFLFVFQVYGSCFVCINFKIRIYWFRQAWFIMCFASVDFFGLCSLFTSFLTLFFNLSFLLCSTCFWSCFLSVCCHLVLAMFDPFGRWIGSKSQRSQRSQRTEKSEMEQFFCDVSFVVCLTLFWICF